MICACARADVRVWMGVGSWTVGACPRVFVMKALPGAPWGKNVLPEALTPRTLHRTLYVIQQACGGPKLSQLKLI